MSGSASCTVFVSDISGTGKCGENERPGNCQNYSCEKGCKKKQKQKEINTGTAERKGIKESL